MINDECVTTINTETILQCRLIAQLASAAV